MLMMSTLFKTNSLRWIFFKFYFSGNIQMYMEKDCQQFSRYASGPIIGSVLAIWIFQCCCSFNCNYYNLPNWHTFIFNWTSQKNFCFFCRKGRIIQISIMQMSFLLPLSTWFCFQVLFTSEHTTMEAVTSNWTKKYPIYEWNVG